MPDRTAKMFIHRCICGLVSVLLALAITVGSTTFATAALGVRTMSGPMQDVVVQACRTELSGGVADQFCDGSDEAPMNNSPCPMIGICVNMGSGSAHCAPLGLTGAAALEGRPAAAGAVRFIRDDIQATGLPAEPQFQPPIL